MKLASHLLCYVGVFSALLNYVVSCCSESDDESEQEILSKAVHVLIRTVRRNEMVCSNNDIRFVYYVNNS